MITQTLKKLPIGIQNFEDIRTNGYLYVDKTALVYQLANGGKCHFLSRPRRFGKSLLVSTLKAYFKGKKELFSGLAIERLERDWVKRPVLHLDLNIGQYDEPQALVSVLNNALTMWEKIYGSESSEDTLGLRFQGVIRRAYKQFGVQVAVLVDEYDKPMLQAIGNEPLQDEYRKILKGFYGALKSMDGCIKFALLTGVTKFSKVSIFSDLNNLNDISLDEAYAELCGITETELQSVFAEYVKAIADKQNVGETEMYTMLKENYDGYHFTKDTSIGMYNPFSLLNAFSKKDIDSYWFATGTPTFLIDLIKDKDYDLQDILNNEIEAGVLDDIDTLYSNPVPIMYQSGYLTIKDYNPMFDSYTLGFPNKEVKRGFMVYLMNYYARQAETTEFKTDLFVKDLWAGDVENFTNRLKCFFAKYPYDLVKNLENHYQNVLYTLYTLMGLYVEAEYKTVNGRIDMVVKTKEYCYVMEFKLNGSAQEAMEQINSKDYALPFECGNRKIIKIGMNFNSDTKNLEDIVVQ